MEFDKEYDSRLFGIEAELFRLYINVAREDIVENDVFDERVLVVLFIVEVFNI